MSGAHTVPKEPWAVNSPSRMNISTESDSVIRPSRVMREPEFAMMSPGCRESTGLQAGELALGELIVVLARYPRGHDLLE